VESFKKIIRGKKSDTGDIKNIEEGNLANKFNLYYIQNIDNLIKSIGGNVISDQIKVYTIVTRKDSVKDFESINVQKLEKIVTELAHKKKIEEGITSEILKVSFHVIRKKFVGLVGMIF